MLAGGRSSRMGRDKALVEFRGTPLVAHALGILRGAGLGASIAGSQSTLAEFAEVVEDSQAGLGPLGGICAALATTSADLAAFLPVDMPLLPVSLIDFLVRQARTSGAPVTLCSVAGFVQSFPVVLRRNLLSSLKSELEAGRGGCFSAFKAAVASTGESMSVLPVDLLAQCAKLADIGGMSAINWFVNLNNEEDLRRAETILSGTPTT